VKLQFEVELVLPKFNSRFKLQN